MRLEWAHEIVHQTQANQLIWSDKCYSIHKKYDPLQKVISPFFFFVFIRFIKGQLKWKIYIGFFLHSVQFLSDLYATIHMCVRIFCWLIRFVWYKECRPYKSTLMAKSISIKLKLFEWILRIVSSEFHLVQNVYVFNAKSISVLFAYMRISTLHNLFLILAINIVPIRVSLNGEAEENGRTLKK